MTVKILVGDALSTLRKLDPESVHCVITSPPYFGLRDYGTAVWEGGLPTMNTWLENMASTYTCEDCDLVFDLDKLERGPNNFAQGCPNCGETCVPYVCDHLKKTPPARGERPGGMPKGKRTPQDFGSPTNDAQAHSQRIFKDTCPKCGAIRIDKQMGLESTPELFIANMVEVFREVRRVLRSDGVCWVNMGDSYASQGTRKHGGFNGEHDSKYRNRPGAKSQQRIKGNSAGYMDLSLTTLKPKDLMGMPWRLALALQQPHLKCSGCDNVAHKSTWGHFPNGRLICPNCELSKGWEVEEKGWWLRSDIIWAKPNPMPESVTDRPTKAHEYVFLLTKSAGYFYDNEAVREVNTTNQGRADKPKAKLLERPDKVAFYSERYYNPAGRNRRTVWTIPSYPFSAAHFATFPPKLVEPMIKAGTSERGCCSECGAPWKRNIARKANYTKRQDRDQYNNTPMVDSSGWKPATVTDNGWQPTCTCHGHFETIESDSDFLKPLRVYIPDEDAPDPIPCTVLDPFAGACTVGLVADRLGRDAIMIELNPEYAAMGKQRIADDAGWVTEVEVEEETAVMQMGLFEGDG